MNEELNRQIREIAEKFPTSYSTIIKLKASCKNLCTYVMESTKEFPDLPFPTRIYYVLTGKTEYVKCKVCGKDIPHDRKCNALTGYASLCCSRPCAQLDPDHKERQRKLSMARYGVPHPNQSPEVRKKMSETKRKFSLEKKAEIQAKSEATCMEHFGVRHPSQSKLVVEKIKAAWENKTEKELAERDAKSSATRKERYGDENYRNSEKMKETRKRHKEEDPDFEKKAQEKREATCMEKYGVRNTYQVEEFKARSEFKKHVTAYRKYYENNPVAEPLFTAEEYAENPDAEFQWKCRTCGSVFTQKRYASSVKIVRCYECEPLLHNVSGAEKDLAEFVRSVYGGEVVENSRKVIPPREIDVYVPSLKLAIEYDGLYWHSESMGTLSSYHLEKTEACEAAGIRLVHVFESDWLGENGLAKDSLKRALGVCGKSFGVEELNIRETAPEEAFIFHSVAGKKLGREPLFSFGAYDGNALAACVSFERSKLCKAAPFEMVAVSFVRDCDVRGIVGAAMEAFDAKFGREDVVRYVDRARESASEYEKAGFSLDHVQRPTPWYWDYGHDARRLLSRHDVRKPEFRAGLKPFDPDRTEAENLAANKIMRVYDCGNLVYVRRRSK